MQRAETLLKMEISVALRTRSSLLRQIQILMMKASFLRNKRVLGNLDEGRTGTPLQVSMMKTLRNLHRQKDVKREVWRAKAWIEMHLLRPVTRKLLKKRSQRWGSVLMKSQYQNWNLQQSVVAACGMFERIDADKRRK